VKRPVIAVLTLVLSLGPARSALGQEMIGDFYLFERGDAATGEDRSSITTLADESWVSGSGGLTLQCSAAGLELVVSATYMGRRLSTPVRYAFGEEPPHAASWSLRSTGMAAIAPSEVRDAFLARAVNEDSVKVRVTDFQLRGYTYTFHLGSLEEALAHLSCR
jgi:hypothetical protein